MADNPVILITRPEPQANRFAQMLTDRGLLTVETVVIPLIKNTFFEKPISNDGFDAVAFTSETGVRAAATNWSGPKGLAFAVGPRTADTATEFGWQAKSADGQARDLADLMAREVPGANVLWPCGVAAGPEFEVRASNLGLRVSRFEIYDVEDTGRCSDLLNAAREAGSVLLPVFSPASAQRAAECLKNFEGPVHLVAISQAAAEAFGPSDRVTIADAPNGKAMIAALQAIFRT